jgi:AcrR family transcriptional regulator
MRERLLDAATELFADQGIAATSMTEIAARVGVTPAMLHYYFKTRERLLDVIVEERLGQVIAVVSEGVSGAGDDPAAMVRDLVARVVGMVEARPWFPSLWIREIAGEGGQLRERLIRRLPLDVHMRFGACIAEGQKRGTVNPGLHPHLLFVSILGLTLFPLAVAKIWKHFPTLKEVGNREVAGHAISLLLYGLTGAGRKQSTREKKKPGAEYARPKRGSERPEESSCQRG